MINQRIILRVAHNDFGTFVAKAFELLNPGAVFELNWHHEAMAACIDRMQAGELLNLLVNMPPRFAKSFYFSIALPAWLLGHDPTAKIVAVSYSEAIIETLAGDCLRLMETDWYRRLFPDTILVKRTQRDIKTTAGGRRFATTIGGSLTGMGGSWIIVDDPMNATLAYSEPIRKQVTAFFDGTLSTRADNPKTARTIIVMQRLHEDDLAGHVLAQGTFEHLKLEAKATEARRISLGGDRYHDVQVEDLLQASRVDDAVLARKRAQMGTASFEAQYQQNPQPDAGNQIKRVWLQRYTTVPSYEASYIVQSWDTATKTAVENDYSVCTTWAYVQGTSYLLDVWRGKLEFPGLRERVIALHNRYSPRYLLIEDAGSGASLIQDLRASSPFNIQARKTTLAKAARVDAVAGAIQSGWLLLPHQAPWLADFERELLAFPGGRHDDQVDSLTQYAMWATNDARLQFFKVHWMHEETPTMDSIANLLIRQRQFGWR